MNEWETGRRQSTFQPNPWWKSEDTQVQNAKSETVNGCPGRKQGGAANRNQTEVGTGKGEGGASQEFALNSGVRSPCGAVWCLASSVSGCMKTQGGDRPHLLVGLSKTVFLIVGLSGQPPAEWGWGDQRSGIKAVALTTRLSLFFRSTFHLIRCMSDHLVLVNCYSEVFLDIQEGREKNDIQCLLCARHFIYASPLEPHCLPVSKALWSPLWTGENRGMGTQ